MARWPRFLAWALLASVLLHLGTLLAQPLYDWWLHRDAPPLKVQQTKRQLQAQALDDSLTGSASKVKPAEQQQVYLASPALPVQPVKKAAPAPKAVASQAAKETVASKVAQESASQVAALAALSASRASSVASAVLASSPASAPLSVVASEAASSPAKLARSQGASRASKASTAATQINHQAAKRFPREVLIEYRYAVMNAFLHWKLADGRYDLELKVLPVGIRYVSRGRIGKAGVMPEFFADLSNGPDKPKNSVEFNWETMEATITNKSQVTIEPFEPGDQDVMSAGLHLALMGGGQAQYGMAMFTGKKRYPDVHFAGKGEAQIRVGQQDLTAVLLAADNKANHADFWLAPDWHNLPIRMQIYTEKYGRFDLTAYNLTLDGKKVLEWVDPNKSGMRR